MIKAGHLKRYLREVDQGVESEQPTSRIVASLAASSEARIAINYILGDPTDDQYQSKRQ